MQIAQRYNAPEKGHVGVLRIVGQVVVDGLSFSTKGD
jgi:hypothetical protein